MSKTLKPYPEYKDSGLPWLGEIPSHWDEKRAKYFFREVDERSSTGQEEMLSVSHITGVTPRSQKNVTMFEAESNVNHKLCHAGDLVINTMWAWMAALGLAKQTGMVSPSYAVYRPISSKVLADGYIDHLLRTEAYATEYLCRSTGIHSSRLRLYPEEFLEIPIICPPCSEQMQMLAFLDFEDRHIRRYIRAKQKLFKLLEEQKQVIIHRAVTRGLDSKVHLKHSGFNWMGEIPEHWGIISWRRLILSLKDFSSNGSFAGLRENIRYLDRPDYARLVRLTDLRKGLVPDEGVYVSKESYEYLSHSSLFGGEFLIANVGAHAGYVCEMPMIGLPATLGPNMMLAKKINTEKVSRSFLITSSQSQMINNQLRLIATQSAAQPKLDKDDVRTVITPLPPKPEQEEIVKFIKDIVNKYLEIFDQIEKEIDLIQRYRSSLISEVVTGKLDVRALPLMFLKDSNDSNDVVKDLEAEETVEIEEANDEDDRYLRERT